VCSSDLIGADEDAKIREETAGQVSRLPAQQKEGTMPEATNAPAGAPATPPAAPAPAPERAEAPKPENREVAEELRCRTIRALAPRDMADDADRLVVEGKSVDEAGELLGVSQPTVRWLAEGLRIKLASDATVRETARGMGFPDSYIFTVPPTVAKAKLGDAVSPPPGAAVIRRVMESI
jgi:site-specific DNA-cytosine methylase